MAVSKVVTRSICFDPDVYEAVEGDKNRTGWGSQSRVINHILRKWYKLKPRANPYQRTPKEKS